MRMINVELFFTQTEVAYSNYNYKRPHFEFLLPPHIYYVKKIHYSEGEWNDLPYPIYLWVNAHCSISAITHCVALNNENN